MITESARAKINLTLHVYPPRADGYHPLTSLVMFADVGDVLSGKPADMFSLTIDGPFADRLLGDDNLILRAAKLSGHPPARFHLTKNLPVASGMGGGSADAAAALRIMETLYGPIDGLERIALSIGADVPVCLRSKTSLMRGIGERLDRVPIQARYPALLVNSGVAVSSAAIFKAYDAGPMRADHSEPVMQPDDVLTYAREASNDLQKPACALAPAISEVISLLEQQKGAALTRMSGSGATCFAIFETQSQAEEAARVISRTHPDWWVVPTVLGDDVSGEII